MRSVRRIVFSALIAALWGGWAWAESPRSEPIFDAVCEMRSGTAFDRSKDWSFAKPGGHWRYRIARDLSLSIEPLHEQVETGTDFYSEYAPLAQVSEEGYTGYFFSYRHYSKKKDAKRQWVRAGTISITEEGGEVVARMSEHFLGKSANRVWVTTYDCVKLQ